MARIRCSFFAFAIVAATLVSIQTMLISQVLLGKGPYASEQISRRTNYIQLLRQAAFGPDFPSPSDFTPTTLEALKLQSILDGQNEMNNTLKANGAFSKIILPNSDGFNPSILPLPPGSVYSFWVVFRRRSSKQDGLYSELVSCFLEQDQDGDFHCVTSMIVLNDVQYNRTETANFLALGPENARVLFGLQGQPLMVYGNTSLVHNRGLWIQDLRKVFKPHEFADHFPAGYFDSAPIVVQRPTEFVLPLGNWKKNIFPFNDFRTNKMYLVDHYRGPEPSLFPYDELTGNTSEPILGRNGTDCMYKYIGEYQNGEIHGASNMLRIVLCNESDGCSLTTENVLRIGVIQYRVMEPRTYFPLVVTMFDAEPFSYRSISPSLRFKGEKSFQYVTSMQFIHTKNAGAGLSDLGYLDSQVLISLGIDDRSSGAVVVQAIDLLKEQIAC